MQCPGLVIVSGTAPTREYYAVIQRAQCWWATTCTCVCRDEESNPGPPGSETSVLPLVGHRPSEASLVAAYQFSRAFIISSTRRRMAVRYRLPTLCAVKRIAVIRWLSGENGAFIYDYAITGAKNVDKHEYYFETEVIVRLRATKYYSKTKFSLGLVSSNLQLDFESALGPSISLRHHREGEGVNLFDWRLMTRGGRGVVVHDDRSSMRNHTVHYN